MRVLPLLILPLAFLLSSASPSVQRSRDPLPHSGRPVLANGFFATEAESDTLTCNGVFSNARTRRRVRPAHAARIPGFGALTWKIEGESLESYEAELRSGVVTRTSRVGSLVLRKLMYAHRTRPLLVTEIHMSEEAHLALTWNGGDDSPDISFEHSELSAPGLHVWRGVTTKEEYPGAGLHRVGVATRVTDVNATFVSFVAAYSCSNVSDADAHAVSLLDAAPAPSQLLAEHRAAWDALTLDRGIFVESSRYARLTNASTLDILSSLLPEASSAFSPSGLVATEPYPGHVFWDAEVFVFPAVLLFHPEYARSILQYRMDRMEAAAYNAGLGGYEGLRFPWESAGSGRETGRDFKMRRHEVHVSSAVALAVELYTEMTGDERFLPMLLGVCEFFSSRGLTKVLPPDEYAKVTDQCAYTSAAAARNFRACARFFPEHGQRFSHLARDIVLPFAEGIHHEYAGWNVQNPPKIKQASVVLLSYPLDVRMSPETACRNIRYYDPLVDPDGPEMTAAFTLISALTCDPARAHLFLPRVYRTVRGPFDVWFEQTGGRGARHFYTSAGAALQMWSFGYAGLRVHPDHLHFHPHPPPAPVTLRRLKYRGREITLEWDEDAVEVTIQSGEPLELFAGGTVYPLVVGEESVVLSLVEFSVAEHATQQTGEKDEL